MNNFIYWFFFYTLKIIFHTLNEYIIEITKFLKNTDIFSSIFVLYNILNQLKIENMIKRALYIIKIFHSNIQFENLKTQTD